MTSGGLVQTEGRNRDTEERVGEVDEWENEEEA